MSQAHWSDPAAVISPVDALAEIDRELKGVEDERKRRSLNRIETFFNATGPHRRELYPRHMAFFRAGKYYRARCFSAGNRTGKTIAGSFELTLHLTGRYPDWWPGRRFDTAGLYWACGTTNETTKNILQAELLGRLEKDTSVGEDVIGMGTGMIPAADIAGVEFHAQIRGAIKTAWIRHVSGKRSELGFRSFEAGQPAFEGVARQGILLDEEPPLDVYTECLMRLMTTGGCLMLTSTPLKGLTDVVAQFMPDGVVPEWQTCKVCGKQLMDFDHACPVE
jgi:phage terminase large subunit-like protein